MLLMAGTRSALADTGKAHGPIPITPPATWLRAEDYPVAAAKHEEEGQTGVRLTVDREGFVATCTVTQPSGNALLDDTTCALLRARAWFLPQRDEAGTAQQGEWSTRISWRLPGTADGMEQPGEAEMLAEVKQAEMATESFLRNFESFSSETRFTVHDDGRLSDCEQRFTGSLAARFAPFRCSDMPPSGPAFKNADGQAVTKHVVMRHSVDVDEADQAVLPVKP